MLEGLVNRYGRYRRAFVTAALGGCVAAPVVAAATQSPASITPAFLTQLGAFGAGYFTNLISNKLARSKPAPDEDEIKNLLAEAIAASAGVAEDATLSDDAQRHIAILLADPTVIEGVMTIAREQGQNVLAVRPDSEAKATLSSLGLPAEAVDDTEWLLDELTEALDELARRPNQLDVALARTYHKLHTSTP